MVAGQVLFSSFFFFLWPLNTFSQRRLGQMLKKCVFSCEPTSGQYGFLGKHLCSCWPESQHGIMLGNPSASNMNNSGTYLGDQWVDLETSHRSSWLVTATSQVQGLTCMVSSSLNILRFFVKHPVALIPQIEINHLAVQKADTRIALIHFIGFFWFLRDFFFKFNLVIYVCVYIYAQMQVLQDTVVLSKILDSEMLRGWGERELKSAL